jgi:hypothetical protein
MLPSLPKHVETWINAQAHLPRYLITNAAAQRQRTSLTRDGWRDVFDALTRDPSLLRAFLFSAIHDAIADMLFAAHIGLPDVPKTQ